MQESVVARTPLPLHRRLSARLAAGVVLVLVVALVIAGAWIGLREHQRFEEQHREHAAQVSRMVARTLSERMLAGGGSAVWQDVTQVSRELSAAVGARRILVLARDGRVKATTDPALEGHRFSRDTDPECADCHGAGMRRFPSAVVRADGGGRLLRVVGAIEKLPGCGACHREPEAFRGMIAIDFDLAGTAAAARDRERLLFGIGLAAALAMAAFLILLLRELVHRPIGDLARSAHDLGGGDLASRIPVRRDDELGRLAGEFNRMAARIQEQVERIESGRREMELIYNLVVEASRNMEVAQVRDAVLKVLGDRLPFRQLIFCVAAGERGWSTKIRDVSGREESFSGGGEFSRVLAGDDEALAAALPGVPAGLLRQACGQRRSVHDSAGGSDHLVVPLEHLGQLAGIVVASHGSPARPPDETLLRNLAVHLGLALGNALNFTQSITDGLTGLANKRHGLVRLEESLYAARRHGMPVSVMMIDIDHFKRVNDTRGHLAGDAVLRAVAARLRAVLRTGDTLSRYGGEEFMAVLPHTPAPALAELGERLRGAISGAAVDLPGGADALAVTVSLGAAQYEPDTDTATTLIARADEALYAAKRGGRDRVVVSGRGDQS
ncbi:MAG: diguanylate cyclase [Betaproteobacteria bacterium]|nr:diguanylate cyclase [Betaproteobacteria bacterium]